MLQEHVIISLRNEVELIGGQVAESESYVEPNVE